MTMMAPQADEIVEIVGGFENWFPANLQVDDLPESLVLRHLGLPEGVKLDDSFNHHLALARDWFAANATPWASANLRRIEQIAEDYVALEGGITFRSDVLADGFRSANVHAVIVAGIAAGVAVDDEIDRLWKAGRPDDAMFLNAFAIGVVEHLRERASKGLAESFAAAGALLVLPHYSPGYEGWPLENQSALFAALENPGPIRVLESGGLQPAKSTLAAFGIANRLESAETMALGSFWDRLSRSASVVHDRPEYAFAPRTLKKWSRERLTLIARSGGRLAASFRVSGTTCANMGLPLTFQYSVDLEPEPEGGFRIQNCRCEPAANDRNHRSTCLYLSDPDALQAGMAAKPPLEGQLIDDALHWSPDVSPAGCLCLQSSRDHKWRIVLQTIHYALCQDANTNHSPNSTSSFVNPS
jgi:hypothetical protein